jgi:hypothetical protein
MTQPYSAFVVAMFLRCHCPVVEIHNFLPIPAACYLQLARFRHFPIGGRVSRWLDGGEADKQVVNLLAMLGAAGSLFALAGLSGLGRDGVGCGIERAVENRLAGCRGDWTDPGDQPGPCDRRSDGLHFDGPPGLAWQW